MTVTLIVMVFTIAYIALRTASIRRVKVFILVAVISTSITSIAYLTGIALFTYRQPGFGKLWAKGYICTQEALKVFGNKCPDFGIDELRSVEFQEDRLWTPNSIAKVRIGLLTVWLTAHTSVALTVVGLLCIFVFRHSEVAHFGTKKKESRNIDSNDRNNTNIKEKNMFVFISYAKEDIEFATKIYKDIEELPGIKPWIDKVNLLPGQNWKIAINKAINNSRYFLALLSSNSVSKRGYVQKELKIALDILDEFPQSDIFIVPIRLDHCDPVDEKLQNLHWVDFFPSYKAGFEDLLRIFHPEYTENRR